MIYRMTYFRSRMISLLLSIVSFVGIFVIFKLITRFGASTFDTIFVNYIVAGALGWTLSGGLEAFTSKMTETWPWVALGMGMAFLPLFYLIAKSTQSLGIATTSVATKLSMMIPVAVFLIADPEDGLSWQKGLAMAMSIPAVILSSAKDGERMDFSTLRLPLIIFFGSGMIDLIFGWFSGEQHMTRVEDQYLFATLPFTVAGLSGLAYGLATKKKRESGTTISRTLLAGTMLGLVNFASLYFLLRAYADLPMDFEALQRSAITPLNNLGVVVTCALVAAVFFREPLNRRNYLGLGLGAAAIGLLLAS